MKQYIKDNEGNLIEVTDLQEAIFQVAKYISFLYDNPNNEQADSFLKRQKYWKDIYIKLNRLKEKRALTS
jgi:hypothetical protein